MSQVAAIHLLRERCRCQALPSDCRQLGVFAVGPQHTARRMRAGKRRPRCRNERLARRRPRAVKRRRSLKVWLMGTCCSGWAWALAR